MKEIQERSITVLKSILRGGTVLGLITVLGAFTLTACSAVIQYSVLDRAATPTDTLPAGVLDSDAEIAFSSSRFIGVDDGVSLWLAAPAEKYGICLIVYPDEQSWSVACSGSGLEVDSGSGAHYAVYPDGTPDKEGMRRISRNVFAN